VAAFQTFGRGRISAFANTLWKFETSIWPVLQVVDLQRFMGWLAALDDFRNWLIREAA
jgi:hypothetical protein